MISNPIQITLLAIGYVSVVMLLQTIVQEILVPRLSFSKSSTTNLKHMCVHWILYLRRARVVWSTDIIAIMMISLLVTAVAILPINGSSGLAVERPELAISILVIGFYFFRLIINWRGQDRSSWEQALEDLLFGGFRAFGFLMLIAGAYLSRPLEFEGLMGKDWLLFETPFHFIALLVGILMIGIFQGSRPMYRLGGMAALAWRLEAIFWMTLLLVTYLNTAVVPGVAYFSALVFKCLGLLFLLDLARTHIPKLRTDQLERVGLNLILPLIMLAFVGMWWSRP